MKLKFFVYAVALLTAVAGCKEKEKDKAAVNSAPVITDDGKRIELKDTTSLSMFTTEVINAANLQSQFAAPARVAAIVVRSQEGAGNNIVLFDNPELAGTYSQLIQHLVNIQQKQNIVEQKKLIIKQKQVELSRFKDLAAHGAGTGKDVSDAQTEVIMAETDLRVAMNDIANEKSSIIEQEATLKQAGFDPQLLLHSGTGKAYVTSDIPENQISKIKEGTSCRLSFTAYPDETFPGHIDDVADVVDNITRMVKLRITLPNNNNKLRCGMFGQASFEIKAGNNIISVPKSSILVAQGKTYVFVKTARNIFERREINAGQQTGDRMVVLAGLHDNDSIVTNGVMQLKGLSLGY